MRSSLTASQKGRQWPAPDKTPEQRNADATSRTADRHHPGRVRPRRKGYEDWGLPAEEDEVVAWKVTSLREAGTHIMGRATYEEMASVWPTRLAFTQT